MKGFFQDKRDNEVCPQDRERALKLWKKVYGMTVSRTSKLSSWARDFRDLREKDGASDEEIEETLNAYLPLISLTMSSKEGGFMPQAFSAKTFRAKYLSIRARLMCLKNKESNSDELKEGLFFKAERACLENGAFKITRNGRVSRKTDSGWVWIKEGEEQDWCPPVEVFIFIRFCRGDPTLKVDLEDL